MNLVVIRIHAFVVGDTQLIIDSEFNYPELSWGCYTKPPVRVSSGYSRRIYTRLGREEDC